MAATAGEADPSSASIIVHYGGQSNKIQFSRATQPCEVDRAICVSCGVPWGSVTQLVDSTGAIYATDPKAFPDGKELFLEVFATPVCCTVGSKLKVVSDEPASEPEAEGAPSAPSTRPYKILLLGQSGVGKTAYLSRLKSKNPKRYKLSKEEPIPGLGVDVGKVLLETSRGEVEIKFWDVAGSDEQAGLRNMYYSGADAAIIFFRYDILPTYWQTIKWHNDVVRACGESLPVVICGLHGDHSAAKEGGELVDSPAVKVSVKSGNNMYAPLLFVLRKILKDPEFKCKLASSKTQVPDSFDKHKLIEHITSTWQ